MPTVMVPFDAPPPRTEGQGGWKAVYLWWLAHTGRVIYSCEAAAITKQNVLWSRKHDAEFAADEQAAIDEAVQRLEDEAWRRAFLSSDRLLVNLLQVYAPERWNATKAQQASNADDPDAQVVFTLNIGKATGETGENRSRVANDKASTVIEGEFA